MAVADDWRKPDVVQNLHRGYASEPRTAAKHPVAATADRSTPSKAPPQRPKRGILAAGRETARRDRVMSSRNCVFHCVQSTNGSIYVAAADANILSGRHVGSSQQVNIRYLAPDEQNSSF